MSINTIARIILTEVNDVTKEEKVLSDVSEILVKTFSSANLNADYVMTYVCNEYVNKDKQSRKFKQIDKLSKLCTSSKLQDTRNSMKTEIKKDETKKDETKKDETIKKILNKKQASIALAKLKASVK